MARQTRCCDFDLRVPSRVPKFQTVPEAARDGRDYALGENKQTTTKQRRFTEHGDHRHPITVARIRVKCAATVRPGEFQVRAANFA
jgi:hypothetical protein